MGAKLAELPVGQAFVHPRTDLKFAVYVSHWAKRHGMKFRTRRVEFGRKVERLA